MCLLYIKTSTLIVPMAAHFLNNLVASGFSAIAIRSDAEGRAVDFQDLETGLMVAVAGSDSYADAARVVHRPQLAPAWGDGAIPG